MNLVPYVPDPDSLNPESGSRPRVFMTKMLKSRYSLRKNVIKMPYIASLKPKKEVQALGKAFNPEM
jgi:hypothetical protein